MSSLFPGLPPLEPRAAQLQPTPPTLPNQPAPVTKEPTPGAVTGTGPSSQPLPPQPQVGTAPVPGQPVPFTGTGTPASPVTFKRGEPVGFFTDATLCIGCKACEVACKEWNQLPAELGKDGQTLPMSGQSYDNTLHLSGTTYRHVAFVENFDLSDPNRVGGQWSMMSDVCKHCVQAGCLEVCPTGAIMRTEFDTVYIQQDICNGCRYCVTACPFGVIEMTEQGVAGKCTFCYDRLQSGLTPACAQACPTASISFGPIDQIQQRADARLASLHQEGRTKAQLYGRDPSMLGGLNAFFLIEDSPEKYGLPVAPQLPSRNNLPSGLLGLAAAVLTGLASMLAFRKHRVETVAAEGEEGGAAHAS
ncbi:MAG: 4Fe-4S dicluster domain-containing protein [Chloroflexi bacterium]|nr:4Fe-4S dicluster domain-containing protein [Chloroflexota bacterium]